MSKVCEGVPDSGAWSVDHLKRGLKAGWPICLGYFPIGLAFGVLAQKAGLRPVEAGFMSVLVFAGSSQFIAVSMLNAGAAATAVIATTFVVNLRHVLMSSSLAVSLRGSSSAYLLLFAYGVTDESFAVNMSRFRDENWGRNEALVVNFISNAAWILSSVAGGYTGRFIPAGSFGIDYALIAMFLCLLVFQLRGRIYTITAILSGLLALTVSLMVPGNSYVVIASLSAATGGFFLRRYVQQRRISSV